MMMYVAHELLYTLLTVLAAMHTSMLVLQRQQNAAHCNIL